MLTGGQRHHRERVSEALKQELALIVQGELADPRVGAVVVTDVQSNTGGKSLRVYVQAQNEELREGDTLKGLNAAKGYVRHELADRLGLKRVPEIIFVLDRSPQAVARVDELLQRVERRKSKQK